MSQESDQDNFEKRTREVLQESTGRLDGRTLSRLTQARHAALAKLEKPARQWWRSYLPVGAGATAAAVLAVVMWTGQSVDPEVPANSVTAQNGSAFEDIDLLADGDAPDFVTDADDLEFYEWAAGEIES
jgi:hypothetical protein